MRIDRSITIAARRSGPSDLSLEGAAQHMKTLTGSSSTRGAALIGLLLILVAGWILPAPAAAQLGSLIVSVTSPTAGSTVTGTITVSASVTIVGALTVQRVQFKLDGVNLGA